ncbi:polysaccharide pyruvyl transferase-domain-containing protein [Dactylonectria estremocensis]|uniref:Polysaccharide pyruvyl transferase-domain-containing protein n=1 Tax=Dactylonectria estremocensis TaxID=1079267 RepID=A0A9P9DHI3_9HYPO|nr:polysaccharide pyruvyl transferase-domain-containing protein [Dactylonectria estremocensis]
MMALRPRVVVGVTLIIVFVLLTSLYTTGNELALSALLNSVQNGISGDKTSGGDPVSYDKNSPPSVGCEDVVSSLQQRVVEAFSREFKDIRYANIFGYLGQTENKGDAVIWVAQETLLATLGITTMSVCRYTDKDCDIEKFRKNLADHQPYSGIIMAGGGNFNDFFMDDHPARLKMAEEFGEYPIRAFPQSINMTKPDTIRWTEQAFGAARDIQLAARDQPSYDWLEKTFGDNAKNVKPNKVKHVLTPDIAFMLGNRPDIRLNTKKTHQIYILARDDSEAAEGNAKEVPVGEGHFDFGSAAGKVSYLKNDWRNLETPEINGGDVVGSDGKTYRVEKEWHPTQRNSAKSMMGFEMLAQAEFVITDRLHGHIMCTLMGIPHVLMDSKLKKNLFLHNTWTKDCDCVRIADNFAEAKQFAEMYFTKKANAKSE